MKACLIAHRFYDNNTHMMQFANALARRGDRVDVISLRDKGLPAEGIVDGVTIYRIQSRTINEKNPFTYLVRMLMFFIRTAVLVTRRHIADPYQVIHVQSVPDFLVFTTILPKLLGAKIILDFRDLVPELYVSKFRKRGTSLTVRVLLRVERLAAQFADHVIVANPVWYDRIIARAGLKGKCTMIWYYPDLSLFVYRLRKKCDGRFVIMYPGSLNWHQGVDVALKAFPRVLSKIPEAELHIYGEGPAKPELIALSERMNLTTRVKIYDAVPVLQIRTLMAACDIGIVPKRASCQFGNEAASTKIPEFMALGIPVVASRTKVESCFFDSSQICYFSSEDEQGLADAIISLYDHPDRMKELSEAGLRYTSENNWDTKKDDYLRLIDRLLGSGQSCLEAA